MTTMFLKIDEITESRTHGYNAGAYVIGQDLLGNNKIMGQYFYK